ncbi:hypothetical protein E4T66_18540 [Sinimarinibacterium sp. CAU 1509]|nr:hypothetical protein E4T66_18540 [Sinimarinibacterium sp. CAU 1509]
MHKSIGAAMRECRKYGTRTVELVVFPEDREHPRFPQQRLRNRLRHYGYRGAALDAEVARIMAGPQAPDGLRFGLHDVYPYGWYKDQMTRVMKRIFCGFGGPQMVVLDEAWRLWASADGSQ